jgi:hypothetical protein
MVEESTGSIGDVVAAQQAAPRSLWIAWSG